MFPVGGGDGGEDGTLGQGGVVPADSRMLQPSLRQQPEDLVKVQPPEFLEIPLRESSKIRINFIGVFKNESGQQ